MSVASFAVVVSMFSETDGIRAIIYGHSETIWQQIIGHWAKRVARSFVYDGRMVLNWNVVWEGSGLSVTMHCQT